ncbi:MAG: hypothetical protein U0894_09180 [Pirellulales bacterium]
MDKQAYLSTWFMYDMVTLTLCGLTFIGLGIYLSPSRRRPPDGHQGREAFCCAEAREEVSLISVKIGVRFTL